MTIGHASRRLWVRHAMLAAAVGLAGLGLWSPAHAAASTATGTFAVPPAYSAAGFATAVFNGGTVAQLEEAARGVGATGVWVEDAQGGVHLLVTGAAQFITDSFAQLYPYGMGQTTVTLTRIVPAAPLTNAELARPDQLQQSHSPFPPPPPKTDTPPASGSNVARIQSSALGLDNYVEDIGIVDGAMDTPHDASYSIGWYFPYDAPGVAGNAVFSAHETWNHKQGPFYDLYLAEKGDPITLKMASGVDYHYRVISHVRYDVDTMPTGDIIWPKDRPDGAQWVTLITCGGRLVYDDSGFGEYLDRDVVVAQRID